MHGTGSQSLLTSAEIEYKIVPTGIEWYEIDESILPGNNSLVYISIIQVTDGKTPGDSEKILELFILEFFTFWIYNQRLDI